MVRDQFRERLEDLILDIDLFYVPSNKVMYTWNNIIEGLGNRVTRLDRFLISSSLLSLPDKLCSLNLPWEGSDHHPIRLIFKAQKHWVPSPFKINPLWLYRPNLIQSISQIWNNWITGSPNFIWEKKLKLVKDFLNIWEKISLQRKDKDKRFSWKLCRRKWKL
jgi:hypothetical protein